MAIDEGLNLDDSQLPHQITGGCRHCLDTTFDTFEDARTFEEKLTKGDYYLAREAEVFAIGLNHPTFTSLIPICISPTSKADNVVGESTNTVLEIVSTIRAKWHSYEISKRLIMSTYNSDSAGQFRKGIGQLLTKDLPKAIRDVYVSAKGNRRCPLLNLVGGGDGSTPSCDNDHLGKRFRSRIKCPMGIMIASVPFTKSDLTTILQQAGIVSSADQAHCLFFSDDLMDVVETVQCLHAVGCLSNIALSDFPNAWRSIHENHQKLKEMRILGLVSKLMCASIVGHLGDVAEEGNHLSVSGYLTVLSKMAHLLFVLYWRNRTSFIPAQNYRNWQEMIKNMYISVTQAKVNGVTDFWWFLNTNKRIEQFFGILRSLRRGNMNFDALDLRNRVADATLVQWIYAQRPEWNDEPRRLRSSADRKNTRSWKGCTKVANVDVVACWTNRRSEALYALRASKSFRAEELDIAAIISAEPGVDMFRPYRRTIGVLSGDKAEYELADLSDAAGDMEPELMNETTGDGN